jgi:hypothetical protein
MRRLRGAVAAALLWMGTPLVARAQELPQAQLQRVGITELPPAVQDTFLAEIGEGRVENLGKVMTATGERYTGQVIADGQATDIEVDTSGVVLKRSAPRDETLEQRARDR